MRNHPRSAYQRGFDDGIYAAQPRAAALAFMTALVGVALGAVAGFLAAQ